LQKADITVLDIDYIAFYEKPYLKFSRIIIDYLISYPFSFKNFLKIIPNWLQDRLVLPLILKKELGYEKKVLFIKHHLSHAASAFLVSPFKEAAILTVDAVGEWATMTYGFGKGNKIKILREICYPNSLGLLYTAVTTYLGFEANSGEGKTMGLAGYGKSRYIDKFREIITVKQDGSFRVDSRFFEFYKGSRMYSNKFIKAFGKPRKDGEKFEERHYDIAASLQKFIEDTLITITRNLYKETKASRLCLAGGIFLNCVVNNKILEKTPFKEIFIQPAAGDSGGALGVAAYIYNSILDNPRSYVMEDAYLGPDFSQNQIKRSILNSNLTFKEYDYVNLAKYIAKKLSQNKTIGWFQGRMEWGPRALGNRSILGNPINPDMKDILNKRIKKRESFRPFAPAILEEKAKDFFELQDNSPFMLLASKVKENKKKFIPAVTHIDGTARIQTVSKKINPKFWQLINEFEKITKVPIIINTSFNLKGEPIVCTPEDAISCFQKSKMDYLVMDNYVIKRK